VKALNKKICLLIVVSLELVSIGSFVQGQTNTIVTITPSSMKIQPSLTAAIDVKVDGFENLFAASVTLAFDSTILRYSGIIGGSFLTRNDANSVFLGVVPQPPPPVAPNKITVDQAIWGGGTVSGSGILFTILFTTIRAGSSPITIVSNEFRNGLNEYILAQTDSGKITVNNAPQAVQLLSPPNGITIDTTFSVMLVWSKSIDIDTGDIVRYKVHLTSTFSNLSFSNLSDTAFTLTKDILKENTEFTWYVDATDGIDTALSRQTFKFKTPMVHYPVEIPDVFKVEQNYPNPFNRSTTIRFSVPLATHADVKVYDITGREIVQLMIDGIDAGYYMALWNGKNSKGVAVGNGIYLYVVTAGSYSDAKKMVFLK
jgi:hypothetical protein